MSQDEVVISGMAGRFPDTDSLEEFQRCLMEKVNLVTLDDRRWPPGALGVPGHVGKIKNRDDIDWTFFGIHRRLCEIMDPHHKLSLEVGYAAIVDAGVNPGDLSGSKTACLVSSVTSETEYECVIGGKNFGHAIIGHSRTMQSNRVSYSFNFKGPSVAFDDNWNGGFQALQVARDMIARGEVTSALVGSASLTYLPEVSCHYQYMGRLNYDGKTKSLSDDADGYSRSEGIVMMFLQRKEDALRQYCTFLTSLSINKGDKLEAFTEFSQQGAVAVLQEAYTKAAVHPKEVAYVEVGGVASKITDARELNAISEVLLPGRSKPLYVGCIKGNVGHTEAAASLMGLVKVLFTAESGLIPPNLFYTRPNQKVPALLNGRMKVATEATPVEGDLFAVSEITATGAYSHAIIRKNPKGKKRQPEVGKLPPDGIPRLVLLSGRVQNILGDVLAKVESMPIDEEFIALTHKVFPKGVKKHLYRGYTILHEGDEPHNQIKPCTGEKKPIWYVFTGMGSQWPGMGSRLMTLPVFAAAIEKCHKVLQPKGIDLINIITCLDKTIFDNILHSFVGIAAIQIGLVDILEALGLKPDGMVGHSVGELGCAYADGCFSTEQMILAAYARGKASLEADIAPGVMAAVGLGYEQIKEMLPEGVEVACHNSAESCTLSGPKQLMEDYIPQLKEKGIFAKLVNVSNIAYHSRYIRPAAPFLLKYLKEVVPEPKLRSKRWISSSVPEGNWELEEAKLCSAEYHTNNLLGSVLFEEASKHIPQDAIVIEIAPHGLLQAILKRALKAATHVALTNRSDPNAVMFLLKALGGLYLEGVSMDLEKLYPPIEFPVSRATPSLDFLLTWDHSENWEKWEFLHYRVMNSFNYTSYINFDLSDGDYTHLKDYKINGRATIPSSLYLDIITKLFNKLRKDNLPYIIMENIRFQKNVEIQSGKREFYVSLQLGGWEVCDGGVEVAGGIVKGLEKWDWSGDEEGEDTGEQIQTFTSSDVYNYLAYMGHQVAPSFTQINSITVSEQEVRGEVRWTGDLVVFLDSVFKMISVIDTKESGYLRLLSGFRRLILNPEFLKPDQDAVVTVRYDKHTRVLRCPGLEILYPVTRASKVPPLQDRHTQLEVPHFMPFHASHINEMLELLDFTKKLVLNNMPSENTGFGRKLNVIEIQDGLNIHKEMETIFQKQTNVEVELRVTEGDDNLGDPSPEMRSESVLIVTGRSERVQRSLRLLEAAQGGFLLFIGNTTPPGLQTLFTRQIHSQLFTLCKTVKNVTNSGEIVLLSNPLWQDELRMKLTEENENLVYLVGTQTGMADIINMIDVCGRMYNDKLLRYIFVDKDTSQFQLSSYKQHLCKDLKVNILREGVWGSILFKNLPISLLPSSQDKSPYKFSHISCPEVKLCALGLNSADVSTLNNKLGVFGYSGEGESGGLVCGLSLLDSQSQTLQLDPVLKWDKPTYLGHEQAASTLLNYAMAYYIYYFGIERRHQEWQPLRDPSVFVHRGALPLSQAIIRVFLADRITVYTSYENNKEKEHLEKLFPQIPSKNVIRCDIPSYDTELLRITDGKGADVVVNTLDEYRHIVSCHRMVRWAGKYIHVNQTSMKSETVMGMKLFLDQTSCLGVTPDAVMSLCVPLKSRIQQLMNDGIRRFIIQPFEFIVLPFSATSCDASSLLRNEVQEFKKLVVSINSEEYLPSKLYLCDPHRDYLVISDMNDLWIDLCVWLINRKARKIHVVVKKYIFLGTAVQKLNSTLNNNPLVRLNFISMKRTQNERETKALIEELNQNNNLAVIFVLGKEESELIGQISGASSGPILICLGSGGEAVVEARTAQGVPGLSISAPPQLPTHALLGALDPLLLSTSHHPLVYLSQYTLKDSQEMNVKIANFWMHLPATVEELLVLGQAERTGSAGGWTELRTRGLAWSHTRELAPIFILPPLRPTQISTLVSGLFHPAFQANIPSYFNDFETLASQLYNRLMRQFSCEVFTVVCSDWSWRLGLALGRLLEVGGKRAALIFLGGSTSWASSVSRETLIDKYLPTTQNEDEGEILGSLDILQHRLSLISGSPPPAQPKFNGCCYLLRPESDQENAHTILQQYMKRPIAIHTIKDGDFLSMFNQPETVSLVNSLILYEYKDSARKTDREAFGASIIDNVRLCPIGLDRS